MSYEVGDSNKVGFNIAFQHVTAPTPSGYKLVFSLIEILAPSRMSGGLYVPARTQVVLSKDLTRSDSGRIEIIRDTANTFDIKTSGVGAHFSGTEGHAVNYLFDYGVDIKIATKFPLMDNIPFVIVGSEDDRPAVTGKMFHVKLDFPGVGNIFRISYNPDVDLPGVNARRIRISHNAPVGSIVKQVMSCHDTFTGISRWGVDYTKNPCGCTPPAALPRP